MANAKTKHSAELRQKTAAEWLKKQRAAGLKYPAVLLPAETLKQVDELKDFYETKTNVYITAINNLKKLHENI